MQGDDVLGKLDDGPAQPVKLVGVSVLTASEEPGIYLPPELGVFRHAFEQKLAGIGDITGWFSNRGG
jgi:hypothetical protein